MPGPIVTISPRSPASGARARSSSSARRGSRGCRRCRGRRAPPADPTWSCESQGVLDALDDAPSAGVHHPVIDLRGGKAVRAGNPRRAPAGRRRRCRGGRGEVQVAVLGPELDLDGAQGAADLMNLRGEDRGALAAEPEPGSSSQSRGSPSSSAAAQPSPKIEEPTTLARESSSEERIRMPAMLSAATTSPSYRGDRSSDCAASASAARRSRSPRQGCGTCRWRGPCRSDPRGGEPEWVRRASRGWRYDRADLPRIDIQPIDGLHGDAEQLCSIWAVRPWSVVASESPLRLRWRRSTPQRLKMRSANSSPFISSIVSTSS